MLCIHIFCLLYLAKHLNVSVQIDPISQPVKIGKYNFRLSGTQTDVTQKSQNTKPKNIVVKLQTTRIALRKLYKRLRNH